MLYSVWVFLLLSAEVMKTHKTNPSFRYIPPNLPSHPTNTHQRRSLQNPHLDHPPHPHPRNKLHRPQRKPNRPSLRRRPRLPLGNRLHQVSRTAREDPTVDRNEAQPTRPTAALCERRSENVRAVRCPPDLECTGAAGQYATESGRRATTRAIDTCTCGIEEMERR